MNQDSNKEFSRKIAKNLEKDIVTSNDGLQDEFLLMRTKALDCIPNNDNRPSFWRFSIVSSGFVAASLMVFAIYLGFSKESENEFEAFTEMNFVAENEEIEMLEEDIEFYLWLESELDKA